jgi:periplasmic divalent cation tolerance protein
MTTPLLGYLTCADSDQAEQIIEVLLEKEFIKCANVLPTAQSYFIWEGELQQSSETIVLLKTTSDYSEKITAIVQMLHSYDLPALVFVEIKDGNPAYLEWLGNS